MAVLGSDGERGGTDGELERGDRMDANPSFGLCEAKRKGCVKEILLLGDGIPSVGSYRHCSSQSP